MSDFETQPQLLVQPAISPVMPERHMSRWIAPAAGVALAALALTGCTEGAPADNPEVVAAAATIESARASLGNLPDATPVLAEPLVITPQAKERSRVYRAVFDANSGTFSPTDEKFLAELAAARRAARNTDDSIVASEAAAYVDRELLDAIDSASGNLYTYDGADPADNANAILVYRAAVKGLSGSERTLGTRLLDVQLATAVKDSASVNEPAQQLLAQITDPKLRGLAEKSVGTSDEAQKADEAIRQAASDAETALNEGTTKYYALLDGDAKSATSVNNALAAYKRAHAEDGGDIKAPAVRDFILNHLNTDDAATSRNVLNLVPGQRFQHMAGIAFDAALADKAVNTLTADSLLYGHTVLADNASAEAMVAAISDPGIKENATKALDVAQAEAAVAAYAGEGEQGADKDAVAAGLLGSVSDPELAALAKAANGGNDEKKADLDGHRVVMTNLGEFTKGVYDTVYSGSNKEAEEIARGTSAYQALNA